MTEATDVAAQNQEKCGSTREAVGRRVHILLHICLTRQTRDVTPDAHNVEHLEFTQNDRTDTQ